MPQEVKLSDYNYELPNERIALFPAERGQSKLLCYQEGQISHRKFTDVLALLTPSHQLFFNNTKVLPARMHFHKETGALIEVFLLHPVFPTKEVASAMLAKHEAVWECTIGNLKKWKDEQPLVLELPDGTQLIAQLHDREAHLVAFRWTGEASFAEVVEMAGKIPLPPYIKREADEADKDRYQTVYSKEKGAVAAPTAGLHFSEEILAQLAQKGVEMHELTLHVGAGTFQPVKEENAINHAMHEEQMLVRRHEIEALLSHKPVVAVGTTSMRTLESLYWFGVKLLQAGKPLPFFIEKLYPYQHAQALPTQQESMQAILGYLDSQQLDVLKGSTEIFIFPSYQFRICKALITNFHTPKSTLLMLIAAFVGEQEWPRIYKEALANDYRFLSYGDSSILFPKK
jgi:S-adenosylmethionine:tRNA ribosyltransferase-isomerase